MNHVMPTTKNKNLWRKMQFVKTEQIFTMIHNWKLDTIWLEKLRIR
jgi:hypothetical protein